MTEIDPPVFLGSDMSDDQVIVFGKSPEQKETDSNDGIARFGGFWRSPNYLQAYRMAASQLLERATREGRLDELALPIFFLQRHTLELLIKTLLRWAFDIAEMRLSLDNSFANRLVQPSDEMKRRSTSCHDLTSLLRDLQSTLKALGYDHLPADLVHTAELISRYEPHHTWSRYESSGPQRRQRHRDTEICVPLAEIRLQLDSVMAATVWSPSCSSDNLELALYAEWDQLFRRIEDVS